MAYVHYTHAEVDRRNPRALAVCDRCGMVYNHSALRWQYEWMGAKIAKLGILVCPSCTDEHQEQLRQIILPRDPIPIEQPRIEPFGVEVTSFLETESNIALLTEAGIAIILEGESTPTLESPYFFGPTTNTDALNALTNPVPPDTTEAV